MTTNFQFKSSLIDYTYEGQGYSYTITPNDWTTIDVDQIAFGQFVSLMSDVYSGAILALNRQKLLDKFEVSLSAATTGGGGSLEPAGDWDIAASTTSGGLVETPLALSVFTDALSSSQNVIYEAGLHTVPYTGPYYFYGGFTTNTVTTDFSTTKWLTLGFTGYNFSVLYDSTGIPVETALADFIVPLINAVDSAVPSVGFSVVDYGGGRAVAVQYRDILTQEFVQVIQVNSATVPDLLTSTTVSFGMNLALGKIYIETDNIAVQEFDIPTDVLSTANELTFFAGGLYGASFSPASLVLTFPDQQNKPPITETSEEITVTPPEDAQDGQLWNIISTGSYDGYDLNNGDSAIFYNGLQNITAITHPPVVNVPNIVAGAITDALAVDGQITLGIDAILATKHFNSYAGEWYAGGQYDGNLTWSAYASSSYSQNTFFLNGAGTLQGDGKFWGLVRDTTANIPGGGISFDLILPFINYGQDELVVEFRQAGTFGDLSAGQKFFRFSFINLDITGSDPTQIEMTTTYCNGNETVVTGVSPTLSVIGEKLLFSITQNEAVAYQYNGGSYNTIASAGQNFTAVDIIAYVGYGREQNGFQPNFVLTQGPKDIILPTAPRLYKTYKAIGTDGYSTLYNKTIKDNDLVTFILNNSNNEDILVEPAEDLSLKASRGPYFSANISDGLTAPATTIYVGTIDTSNITERNIQLSNVIYVTYSDAINALIAPVNIIFNRSEPFTGLDIGRTYVPGEIFQVDFNTLNGGEIFSVIFTDDHLGAIIDNGPVAIPAGKRIIYSFVVMEYAGTIYGTTFKCIGKLEL